MSCPTLSFLKITKGAPRYLSIVTLTVSNVGYFGSFTKAVCKRYYLATPVFKGPFYHRKNCLRRCPRHDCSLTDYGLAYYPWTEVILFFCQSNSRLNVTYRAFAISGCRQSVKWFLIALFIVVNSVSVFGFSESQRTQD